MGKEEYKSTYLRGPLIAAGAAAAVSGAMALGRNWKAVPITDPKYANGCERAAREIRKHIGGDIIRITPKDPRARSLGEFMGHSPGHENQGWAYHEVVVKDGRVYDRFTGSAGLPIDEYKALWKYKDSINFGF